MQNRKTIIALLVAILGIGGLIIWDSRETIKEEEAKKTEKLIFDFAPESIASVHLKNNKDGKSTNVILVKKAEGWSMTEPVDTLADQQAVNELVDSVSKLKYGIKVADTKAAWKQYELDPAVISIEMKDDKGKAYGLSLGAKTQTGYEVYVGLQESGVAYTTTYSLEQTLNKSVFDLRNKNLASIPSSSIKELTYCSPEPFTAKFAVKNGIFELTSPEKLATSQSDVMTFITGIAAFRASEVQDSPTPDFKKKFENSVALYEISWTGTDNNQGKIKFSILNNELWATDNGGRTFLKFDRERDLKVVRKSLVDFREKQILRFSEDDVASAIVDGKKTDKIEGPSRLLMQDLSNLKAVDFADKLPATAAPDKPLHTVEVSLKDKKQFDVKLWKVGADVYVKTSLSKEIYRTTDGILSSIKI